MTEQTNEVVLYAGPAAALARYGETAVVRAVAKRVELYHRGKEPLLPQEALLIAQAAVYHDLDPDPAMGELQWWTQDKREKVEEPGPGGRSIEVWRPRRVLTIMRGKRGNELVANENLQALGSYMDSPRYRLVTDTDERARCRAKDGDLVIECRVSHYRETQDYFNRRTILRDEKMTSKDIDSRIGAEPPSVPGIGILTAEEMAELEKSKNKMTHVERCQKRAKRAAMENAGWLRRPQRQLEAQNLDLSKYAVDGEWIEVVARDPSATAKAAERSSTDLYGPKGNGDVAKRPWKPEVAREAMRRMTMKYERQHSTATDKQRGTAMGVITAIYGGGKEGEEKRHCWLRYCFSVESGKDLTGPQILAIFDWLNLRTGDDGKLIPCDGAVAEAPAIFECFLVEQKPHEPVLEGDFHDVEQLPMEGL
jgi:hypothetical protein